MQGLELDFNAKEATVSQVIQDGRVLMDQLERGTTHYMSNTTFGLRQKNFPNLY